VNVPVVLLFSGMQQGANHNSVGCGSARRPAASAVPSAHCLVSQAGGGEPTGAIRHPPRFWAKGEVWDPEPSSCNGPLPLACHELARDVITERCRLPQHQAPSLPLQLQQRPALARHRGKGELGGDPFLGRGSRFQLQAEQGAVVGSTGRLDRPLRIGAGGASGIAVATRSAQGVHGPTNHCRSVEGVVAEGAQQRATIRLRLLNTRLQGLEASARLPISQVPWSPARIAEMAPL